MDKEYYEIVDVILKHPEFIKRKEYKHHGEISVYEHSLKVSKKAYKMAKKHKKDYKSVAIGGLLHDFYHNPWQENTEKKKFFKKHGFVHAREALENARNVFPQLMNDRVENIILRHMFPLNIKPPKYIEGWYVTLADKIVSLEVLRYPKCILLIFKKGGKK